MTLVKSLLAGIFSFLGLSIVFFLIYYGIDGTLVLKFASMGQYYHIIFEFLAFPAYHGFPPAFTPSDAVLGFITIPASSTILTDVIFYLGILIPPLVAALISGRLAENKLRATLMWLLISLIFSLLGFFGYLFAYVNDLYGLLGSIFYLLLLGAVFTFFFGSFALAANKSEFY